VNRMSKSLGNYIGIDEPPEEMYGKTMRIPDNLIYSYFELVTDVSLAELREIQRQLKDPGVNPRDVKRRLAFTLVRMYHGLEAAQRAEAHFDRVVVKKEVPEDIPEYRVSAGKYRLLDLLVISGLLDSKSEARRRIRQGAVSIDGSVIQDEFFEIELQEPVVIRAGKRAFVKIVPL